MGLLDLSLGKALFQQLHVPNRARRKDTSGHHCQGDGGRLCSVLMSRTPTTLCPDLGLLAAPLVVLHCLVAVAGPLGRNCVELLAGLGGELSERAFTSREEL